MEDPEEARSVLHSEQGSTDEPAKISRKDKEIRVHRLLLEQ